MKKVLNDFVISLSLANLLFISAWWYPINLLHHPYFWKQLPSQSEYIAVMLNVIIFGLVFFAGARLLQAKFKDSMPKIVEAGFGLVCLIALNGIRIQFHETQTWFVAQTGYLPVIFALILLAILWIWLAYKHSGWLISVAKGFLLILSPFILFTYIQAALGIYSASTVIDPPLSNVNPIASATPPSKASTRVVWIIFDAFDYRVAFEKLPSNIKLTEFEKLRTEAFFATNASSPARATLESIPSLITGKVVGKAKIAGRSNLLLQVEGEPALVNWANSENIFTKVKDIGGKTGLTGWYHPYCRIFGETVDNCLWEEYEIGRSDGRTTFSAMISNVKNLFFSIPFGFQLHQRLFIHDQNSSGNSKIENIGYRERHERLMKNSIKISSSEHIRLAFIHLPFPHSPNVYNPETKQFSGGRNYFDNLILTDHALGEIRQNMEASGVWERSTVIVSADHSWGAKKYAQWLTPEEIEITGMTDDTRIPFIVKLPNSKSGLSYDKPFVTTSTKDIIIKIINGDILTNEQLAAFLDSREK